MLKLRGVLSARARLGALAQRPRILKYRALSTCRRVSGSPIVLQPVLFLGPGTIALGEHVEFGWPHVDLVLHRLLPPRGLHAADAAIEIGDGAQINNNAFIKSEGPGNPDRRPRAARLGSDDLRQRLPRPARRTAAAAGNRAWRPWSSRRTCSSAIAS